MKITNDKVKRKKRGGKAKNQRENSHTNIKEEMDGPCGGKQRDMKVRHKK